MIDILFTSVPYTETSEPTMAPGLLKAVAVKHGFTSQAIDLNIELMSAIENSSNTMNVIDFFVHNNLHSDSYHDIIKLIDISANRLLSFNAKIIGLSLLTTHSRVFTKWLCVRLKSISPTTKIIIGGPGIKETLASNENTLCEQLMSSGLIDHYITGDGEIALVELLKGNFEYPGIDSPTWQEIKDIDNFPYPDYDDYDFSLYSEPSIAITDSRGCVRLCDFCNLIEHWKTFVYRPAESLFAEMLAQIERYNIYHFWMRNSLTNGNFKEFKKLMQLIADYNHGKVREKQISWRGYFIIRNEQQHPEELWKIMAKTNPYLLLGVESVVRHVRWGLGKKFENIDIDYHLEMGKKYNIQILIFLIIGYPTETREDYEFTKQWIKDRLHYAGNPIDKLELAHTSILENTGLERKLETLNVTKGDNRLIWINQNTRITTQERADYAAELFEICKPFTLPTGVDRQGIEMLSQIALEHHNG